MLANDRAHATPAEIGTTFNPTPIADNVTDVVVAPTITNVSTDSYIVFRVLNFLYLRFDLLFLSLKYASISLILLI